MHSTRALRQAAHAAERTPLIRFIGKRSIPANIDHTPQPHPQSPSGSLPADFGKASSGPSHSTFSTYRDHAQQHGPLRKTASSGGASGVGMMTGHELGSVAAPKGTFFDRSELPARFRRAPIDLAEIEAIETGGATLSG